MYTKTAVIFLVVASVAYTHCKPPPQQPHGIPPTWFSRYRSNDNQAALNQNQALNDLTDEIWQQVNYQLTAVSTTTVEGKVLPNLKDGPHLDVNAVKASIFSSEALNKWIQQVWQQVSAQYGTLTGQTTKLPIETPSSSPATPGVAQTTEHSLQTPSSSPATPGVAQTTEHSLQTASSTPTTPGLNQSTEQPLQTPSTSPTTTTEVAVNKVVE